MSRSRVLPSGRNGPPPTVKEPLLTRSLASALAIGAPVGVIVWLALQQMPNITWMLTQVLQHIGQ